MDIWLSVVLGAIALNVVIAAFSALTSGYRGQWVLVVLLTGTTGAAASAVLSVFAEDGRRFLDVSVVFALTAAIAVLVRLRASNAASAASNQAGTDPADADSSDRGPGHTDQSSGTVKP